MIIWRKREYNYIFTYTFPLHPVPVRMNVYQRKLKFIRKREKHPGSVLFSYSKGWYVTESVKVQSEDDKNSGHLCLWGQAIIIIYGRYPLYTQLRKRKRVDTNDIAVIWILPNQTSLLFDWPDRDMYLIIYVDAHIHVPCMLTQWISNIVELRVRS